MNTPDSNSVNDFFLNLQDSLCRQLAECDGGAVFTEDKWRREKGGGGRSRVLKSGALFEQAGVNFSHVCGENLPPSASARRMPPATA